MAPETEVDPLEVWLTEQLEALVDELFDRCYRPEQRRWSQARCPWHRRLRAIGLDARCPLCEQIQRTRRQPTEIE